MMELDKLNTTKCMKRISQISMKLSVFFVHHGNG